MWEDWTIRENIRRFRDLLKGERDGNRKRVLEKLLADEEAKLPPKKQRSKKPDIRDC